MAAESAAFCNSDLVKTNQLISMAKATMPRVKGINRQASGMILPRLGAHAGRDWC